MTRRSDGRIGPRGDLARAPVTWALVAFIVVIAVGLALVPGATDDASGRPPRHWWELVTPAFVHGLPGIAPAVHVAVIAPLFVAVGARVEAMLGRRRFLVLTIVAAVTSGASQAVLDRLMTDRDVWASGSSALVWAYGAVIALAWWRRRAAGDDLADDLRPLVVLLFVVVPAVFALVMAAVTDRQPRWVEAVFANVFHVVAVVTGGACLAAGWHHVIGRGSGPARHDDPHPR